MNQEEQKYRRPRGLSILSMLSLTAIILGIFSNLLTLMSSPVPASEMQELKKQTYNEAQKLRNAGQGFVADMNEDLVNIRLKVNEQHYLNAGASVAVMVLGLIGVVLMTRGYRRGFHAYIIYNILSVMLIYISVPPKEVPLYFILINFAFGGLFIWLYSRYMTYFSK